MDLYSKLNPNSKLNNSSYHLIQLSDDILNELENNNENKIINEFDENLLTKYNLNKTFQFKASTEFSTPYLTTFESTYKIRQQNHSNFIMLLKDSNNYFNFTNYLLIEKKQIDYLEENIKFNLKDFKILKLNSFIDLSNTDINNDIDCLTISQLNSIFESSKQLFEKLPISIKQFDYLLNENGLIPNFTSFVKINQNLELIILNLILSNLNIENNQLLITNNQLIDLIFKLQLQIIGKNNLNFKKKHLIIRILINVLFKYLIIEKIDESEKIRKIDDQFLKFTLFNKFNYKLNNNKIIKFLTLTILIKERTILLDDLLIQIRLNLPNNYLPNFEINEILNGFSYIKRQENNQIEINYLSIEELSIFQNPKERFDKLFNLKNQWELNEIQPFVNPLNTKGLKIDKFCLKYCKVKKVKGKTILSKR